jgi:hypothetical protein
VSLFNASEIHNESGEIKEKTVMPCLKIFSITSLQVKIKATKTITRDDSKGIPSSYFPKANHSRCHFVKLLNKYNELV